MTTATVDKEGKVALPREVMEAAGIEPGDEVSFTVSESKKIEIQILHDRPPIELSDEAGSDERSEHQRELRTTGDGVRMTYDELPTLTLAEVLERYRIEGPIDWEHDLEEWHDEAAKDVFGERSDRFPS